MENPQSNEPIRLPDEQPKETQQGDMIVISQTTIYFFLTAIMFFVAGLVVGWVGSTTATSGTIGEIRNMMSTVEVSVRNLPAGAAVAAQPTWTPVPRQTIDPGDGPSWGNPNAKVTMVEFGDFECPYCEIFFQQTYPLLKNNFSDKIHFVFRNFPLSQHPHAIPAALAAECANEQGVFWKYHDLLYTNQNNFAAFERSSLIDYANQAGVKDIDQFTKCYDSSKYMKKIQDDEQTGEGYFVAGTPTFFINGIYISGAQPYNVFATVIQATLCEADPTQQGCANAPSLGSLSGPISAQPAMSTPEATPTPTTNPM